MTHYHLIGIGGTGLSAIARVLLEKGAQVSGSDRVLSPLAKGVQAMGGQVFVGHQASHIRGADVVIRSSAVPDDNVEVRAARAAGIPVLKRADFLGALMDDKVGLAVAGTHGKTTTSAMLAWTLFALQQDPTFIIGGVLQNLGVNARAGQGPHFVIEADEYDRMFLGLKPRLEIITNIEHDHPDCYPDFMDMVQAFTMFVEKLPRDGVLIACSEDVGARAMLRQAVRMGRRSIAYRLALGDETLASREWMLASRIRPNELGGVSFVATSNLSASWMRGVDVRLRLPGNHNVLNALSVLSTVLALELPAEKALLALETFAGTGRRFDVRGTVEGITLVDDYAHHPTEIRATLQAARQRYPQARIWAVWQPHTYSRAHALEAEFIRAFEQADKVIITEIYAAREAKEAYSGADLARAMQHDDVRFMPDFAAIRQYLLEALRPGDVVLVLSAGDAIQISEELWPALQERAR